ncbi:MAG: hypothetical protein HYS55_03495 [Candidatus Omnitrophica bacterium]|nr:hypothetical protein [Candidatus Omnitrophota bacterium]
MRVIHWIILASLCIIYPGISWAHGDHRFHSLEEFAEHVVSHQTDSENRRAQDSKESNISIVSSATQ